MRRGVLSVGLAFVALTCFAQEQPRVEGATNGYVPDESSAIRIAIAAWEPIYGRAEIAGEAPYKATLIDGVWTVEGTLAAGIRGGVAFAEIRQDDGSILRLSHGR